MPFPVGGSRRDKSKYLSKSPRKTRDRTRGTRQDRAERRARERSERERRELSERERRELSERERRELSEKERRDRSERERRELSEKERRRERERERRRRNSSSSRDEYESRVHTRRARRRRRRHRSLDSASPRYTSPSASSRGERKRRKRHRSRYFTPDAMSTPKLNTETAVNPLVAPATGVAPVAVASGIVGPAVATAVMPAAVATAAAPAAVATAVMPAAVATAAAPAATAALPGTAPTAAVAAEPDPSPLPESMLKKLKTYIVSKAELAIQPVSEKAEVAMEQLNTIPAYKKMTMFMEESKKLDEKKSTDRTEHLGKIALRVTTQLKIWVDPEVQETELLYELAKEKFTDPRTNLNKKCIFIGRAEANMDSAAILSYCLPGTDCSRSLCFYAPELADHIEKHVAEKKEGGPVNIWADEIKEKLLKANLPDFAAQVQTTMSDDWVELIKLHALTLKMKADEVKDSFSVILFNKVTNIVCGYFEEHPEDLSTGTAFKSTTSKVKSWFKSIVKFPFKLIYYVLNNPFTVNICIFLSKALRAVVCAYMSGVSAADIKLYLQSMWGEISENPVVMVMIEVAVVLYECITNIGFSWVRGSISGILACFQAAMQSVFINMHLGLGKGLLGMLKNLTLYLAKKILSLFVGKQTADFILYVVEVAADGVLHPKLLWNWLMQNADADESIKKIQLIAVFRDYFFVDFSATVFWGLIAVMPARWLDFILALVLPLIPAAGYAIPIKDFLMSVTNKLFELTGVNKRVDGKKYEVTIGDVLVFCARQAELFRTGMMIFHEIYGWFRDVAGCFVMKFQTQIKYFTNKLRITSFDLLKQDISAACCFKDFVKSLKTALVPTKPPVALTKITQGLTAVASTTKNAMYGVLGMFSDARLKFLLQPVFALKVEGKILRFWLYKVRPNAVNFIPGADEDSLYIGLVAQEVQRAFPDAVSEKKGYLMINMKKLPCNAHAILAGLNGFPMPRKCTTKPLLLPANHYRAHSKKIRY